jgi:hypothetical protein
MQNSGGEVNLVLHQRARGGNDHTEKRDMLQSDRVAKQVLGSNPKRLPVFELQHLNEYELIAREPSISDPRDRAELPPWGRSCHLSVREDARLLTEGEVCGDHV